MKSEVAAAPDISQKNAERNDVRRDKCGWKAQLP